MSKTAHTPGPWQVSGVRQKLGAEDCQCVGPDGFNIAFLPIGRRPHELSGAIADARLISAAPDLLASCKTVLRLLDEGILVRDIAKDGTAQWGMNALNLVRDLQSIQAAVAKAEGEPSGMVPVSEALRTDDEAAP